MLQTIRAEKIDEKKAKNNELICVVFMFPSYVIVLKLSKKEHFLQFFLLILVRNLSLLKQCIFIHLKSLVTHFRKMALLIIL